MPEPNGAVMHGPDEETDVPPYPASTLILPG
jgi:hypothetical protein